MKALVRWIVGIGLVITFPIWMVVLIILKIFDKGAPLTPNEVEQWLTRMRCGEVDDYWWDDFINVPIRDKQLDKLREECEGIWVESSGFLYRDHDGTYRLNESGVAAIERLLERCHEIERERQREGAT